MVRLLVWCAAGLNKEDGSSIIKVFERMAGVTIGSDDD
jgi:hypothetical protein